MCLSYPTRTVRNFTSANITSSVTGTSGQHFGTPFAIFGPFDNARTVINDVRDKLKNADPNYRKELSNPNCSRRRLDVRRLICIDGNGIR